MKELSEKQKKNRAMVEGTALETIVAEMDEFMERFLKSVGRINSKNQKSARIPIVKSTK